MERMRETIGSFDVVGLPLRTSNREAARTIPPHWRAAADAGLLAPEKPGVGPGIYAVYTDYETPGDDVVSGVRDRDSHLARGNRTSGLDAPADDEGVDAVDIIAGSLVVGIDRIDARADAGLLGCEEPGVGSGPPVRGNGAGRFSVRCPKRQANDVEGANHFSHAHHDAHMAPRTHRRFLRTWPGRQFCEWVRTILPVVLPARTAVTA